MNKKDKLLMFSYQYGGSVAFSGIQLQPVHNPLTDPFPQIGLDKGGTKSTKSTKPTTKWSDAEDIDMIKKGPDALVAKYNYSIAEKNKQLSDLFVDVMDGKVDMGDYAQAVVEAKAWRDTKANFAENALSRWNKMNDMEKKKNEKFITKNGNFLAYDYKRDEKTGKVQVDESGNPIITSDHLIAINPTEMSSKDYGRVLTYGDASKLINKIGNENIITTILDEKEASVPISDYEKAIDSRVGALGTIEKNYAISYDGSGNKGFYIKGLHIGSKDGGEVYDFDINNIRSYLKGNAITGKSANKMDNVQKFISQSRSHLTTPELLTLKSKTVDGLVRNGSFDVNDLSSRMNNLDKKSKEYYIKLLNDLRNVGGAYFSKTNMDNAIETLLSSDDFVKAFAKNKSLKAARTDLRNQLEGGTLGLAYNPNISKGVDIVAQELNDDQLKDFKGYLINNSMDKQLLLDVLSRVDKNKSISNAKPLKDVRNEGSEDDKYYSEIVFNNENINLTDYLKSEEYYVENAEGKSTVATFARNLKLKGSKVKLNPETLKKSKESVSLKDHYAITKMADEGTFETVGGDKIRNEDEIDNLIPTDTVYITSVPINNKGEIVFGEPLYIINEATDHLIDTTVEDAIEESIADAEESDKLKYSNLTNNYLAVKLYGAKSAIFEKDDNGEVVAKKKDNQDELEVVKKIVSYINESSLKKDINKHVSGLINTRKNDDSNFKRLADKALDGNGKIKDSFIKNMFNYDLSIQRKLATKVVNVLTPKQFNEYSDKDLNSGELFGTLVGSIGQNKESVFRSLPVNRKQRALTNAKEFYEEIRGDNEKLRQLQKCFNNIRNGTPKNVCQTVALGLKNYADIFLDVSTGRDDDKTLTNFSYSYAMKRSDEEISKNLKNSNYSFVTNIMSTPLVFADVYKNIEKYAQYNTKKYYTKNGSGEKEEVVHDVVQDPLDIRKRVKLTILDLNTL